MKKLRKRKGASLIMVIGTLIFVTLVASLMLSSVNHTIYQTQVYAMQMQAQYINKTVADATVQALIAEEGSDDYLMDKVFDGTLPEPGRIEYKVDKEDGSKELLAVSTMTLTPKVYNYYGTPKPWVEIEIHTFIADTRTARPGEAAEIFKGTSLAGKKSFEYVGTMLVLRENALIQIYNPDRSLMIEGDLGDVIR